MCDVVSSDRGVGVAEVSYPAPWLPLRSLPLLLVVLHAVVACLSAHRVGGGALAPAAILLSICPGFLATWACDADARRRGAALPHSMQYVTLMTWGIAVPTYLVETRGWSGFLWTALWCTTLLVSAAAGGICMVVLRLLST